MPQVEPAAFCFRFVTKQVEYLTLSRIHRIIYADSLEWSIYMTNISKKLLPIILALLIIASLVWYCFVYDRDFTRDVLLGQARNQSTSGNAKIASWFYDLAYDLSGQDENVAIELANQFKAEGNYTKAEYTLSNAIADGGTAELYMALCKTYVEQDKLLDAVNMLDNIADSSIKAELDALRPAAPSSEPIPGYYSQYISVKLNSADAVLHYSTNGEYPSTADQPYTEPFTLSGGETTVYAVGVAQNGLVSPLSILGFTVGGVIEEVTFNDQIIEDSVRQLINREDTQALYTNELWNIHSFTMPEEAQYVDDLTKLTYLQNLTISGQTFDSLRFLAALTDLSELVLTECRIQTDDLAIIAALPNLKRLTLANCSLSTISGLENAQNLEYLDLSNNTIRNLEPLANLIKLKEINLNHNALTGLNVLTALTNLEKLDVSYNALTSIAPIATCTKLAWINADHNDLGSLGAVDNLPALTYLSVSNNDISDVTLLKNNTNLVELYVANNQIEDITELSTLVNLEIFDFSSNKVSKLPFWPDDSTLRMIYGSHNEVTSLDRLKNQMNLTHIYMDYNKITSISALENCFKLVMVNVYGNEIDEVDALTKHDIIVNWDPT